MNVVSANYIVTLVCSFGVPHIVELVPLPLTNKSNTKHMLHQFVDFAPRAGCSSHSHFTSPARQRAPEFGYDSLEYGYDSLVTAT